MYMILAIAAGGGCGAVLRHLFSTAVMHVLGSEFPYGIMLANIIGSLVMGMLVSSFALFWDVSQLTKAFLTVGFLGAFTTFSTFSLDTMLLFERGSYVQAGVYVIASVSLSITALVVGMALVRFLHQV